MAAVHFELKKTVLLRPLGIGIVAPVSRSPEKRELEPNAGLVLHHR